MYHSCADFFPDTNDFYDKEEEVIGREERSKRLLAAARCGSQKKIQYLLDLGTEADVATKEGETALFLAAKNGHHEVAQILLDSGADVNVQNGNETPLYAAAWEGHQEVVQVLLDHGANIDTPIKDGTNPLQGAAKNRRQEIVRILLDRGASVNVATKDGETPLFVSAQNGFQEVVQILLDRGANVDFSAKDEKTPLFIAAWEGHKEVVQVLLDHGANINVSRNGSTPLYVAAREGHKEVVQILLHRGAKLALSKRGGATPLFIAAWNGHQEVVQLLLDKGANADVPTKDGETPLYVAAWKGHKEVVQILLAQGANVNVLRKDGATSLYAAAREGHRAVVQVLLDHGANVNVLREDGATPLYVAAREGRKEVVRVLLEGGANVGVSRKGTTPLYVAAREGHHKVVEVLLDNGANINDSRKDGETLLSIAVKNGAQEVVQVLSDRGAKVNALTKDGETPFYIALAYGNPKIGQILIESGADPLLNQQDDSDGWVMKKREFARYYLPQERVSLVIPDSLHLLVLESIATGILDLGDPSFGFNDEMLENIQWSRIAPFLTRVVVHQKGVSSLPIGLAYLSVETTKQIQFVTDENWRKLDKIKAGESERNIIDYCRAKLEGGVVKMKALRLMVMGGPAVGKTTMIRRLRASSGRGWQWRRSEISDHKSMKLFLSTDGVELGDVELNDGTILETWDFGGQKIYRISHQLFLRDFCVYAVMCRVNDDPEAALKELQFWIESVLSRTQMVQILLITTHGDRLPHKDAEAAHNHLHQSLIRQYGEQKICPHAVMLKRPHSHKLSLFFPREDQGVGELKAVLLKISDKVGFDAPASLEMIRVALESLGGDGPIVKISVVHQVIERVGEQKGIQALRDEERRMKFLEDLDTLGYIYLVRSRRLFSLSSSDSGDSGTPPEMAVVLSPHWISRLLATLITTKHTFAQSSGGVIDRDTLTLHLWQKEEDFPQKYHEDMIDLLVQLHIMFPLRSPSKQQRQQKYLVPCLLKEDEPQQNHGIKNGFGFLVGGENHMVLTRILKMKNQAPVPVAVMPMVIVQLMRIGEVIECWQQGCAVSIYSSNSEKFPEGMVECCCLVKKNQGDELMINLEGISSEVAGWWMKEVMRSLENMLEEFYHVDYQVDVRYHGGGKGGEGLSCFPTGCRFSFNYLYERLAQRNVTALCENETHDVALQYLVPDLLVQEASSLSLVSWENLEIEKELGQGSFGKVLLCSSLFNFQNLRDKKAEIKKKRKEKKEEEEGEEGEEERAVTKCMYAVKVLEISQKMKERNGVLAEEGENGVVGEEGKEKLSCEAGLQKDFLLEVYTMTGLLHPNIVRLVGLTHPLPLSQYPLKNEIHQNHAMVMELVGGGDLYHQANFMGLAISVHINNMIKAIGDYCGQWNLHFAGPKVFQPPEPLPPLSKMCNCAFQKIHQNFEKWWNIAGGSHGKQINDLKNSFEKGIKKSYDRNFDKPGEEKRLFENLKEISVKIEDLIRETTEIYAPLPWVLRLKIAFELARGVQYLHSFNPPIVHRDLKSPNIFLSSPLILFPITENTLREPLVKVGDFGWSVKLLGVSTLIGGENAKTEHVNPTWAAPEVLHGEEFTEKIDIYAIGIILWEILVRRHPFSLDIEVELMEVLAGFIMKKGRPSIPASVLEHENETNPELISKYVNLMNWCWDHQPSNRPTALQVCESLYEMMMQGEASLLRKIVDEEGVLDHLRKDNIVVSVDAPHLSRSHSSRSLCVSKMKVSNMIPPSLSSALLKDENWKVKRVLFAGLDWLWIGFWNGYVGVIEVKKAINGGNAELILCREEDKHDKEVSSMVHQSVGGHVWTSSMCGTLQVWRDMPLTSEDAIGHFNIRGWLRVNYFLSRQDVWVSLDTGRLRIFKHQYFGAEEDSIPINKNTIVESFFSRPRPAIQIHCPERNKMYRFKKAKSENANVKESPSITQWWNALEQLSKMLSFDISLLRLGVKLPQSRGGNKGVRILGLEAVGHSVWGFIQCASKSFEVIEFTLITAGDEHGLCRASRVETKRRIKLNQSEIDIRFQNIGMTGIVSMGMNTLCLAIGNTVGEVHLPSGNEKVHLEWCRKEDRGSYNFRCLASVWNGNWGTPKEEGEAILYHQEPSPSPRSPSSSLSATVRRGPELWAYDGEKILIFRSNSSGGNVHDHSLVLVAKIEVPSDSFLSCLTQTAPNEIWGGNESGAVIGWNIDTRSLLPGPLLHGEQLHDGDVSNLAAPSRAFGVCQKTSIVFSGSIDSTLRLFCLKNS